MMKKYRIVIIIVLIIFFIPDLKGSGDINYGEGDINFPPVKAFNLKNGARIFYIKDELPQVTIVVCIGFGKLYEKKESAGISNLIARTISLAGSKKYPGTKLHEKIDSIGGKISVNSSWENTIISIKVLKKFKNEAFDIVADLINNPNFDREYLETAKALISDRIRRRYDNPEVIAFEKAREIMFDGNGYGSVPTEKKIMSYTLDFVQKTWGKYYKAGNIMIGISTSIDFPEIRRLSTEKFSKIVGGGRMDYEVDKRKIIKKIKENDNRIFLYPKEIPQSTIVIGTIAPDIGYGGSYALRIMNYILGGGSFNSRLMKEIRVKRGLAYAVQSIVRSRYRVGVFLAYAQTDNETACDVLSIMLKNIKKMSKQRIPEDEIDWAKKSIHNSFIFRFVTPMSILTNHIDIEYNKLPGDYYKDYLNHIKMVKEQDILNESRNLFGNGIIKVVVGKKFLAEKLKRYGTVIIINN